VLKVTRLWKFITMYASGLMPARVKFASILKILIIIKNAKVSKTAMAED